MNVRPFSMNLRAAGYERAARYLRPAIEGGLPLTREDGGHRLYITTDSTGALRAVATHGTWPVLVCDESGVYHKREQVPDPIKDHRVLMNWQVASSLRERIRAAAKDEGKTMSRWIRETLTTRLVRDGYIDHLRRG